MVAVESLVNTAFNPKQFEGSIPNLTSIEANSPQHNADKRAQRILEEASGQSVLASFVGGIEVDGIVFNLMTLSAHRTKRDHHMCAVLSYNDGKQADVILPIGEVYTTESLKPHILRAVRAASVIEVFKSPIQIGQEYFTLCQLAQLTDTEVVFIAQSVGLGQVTVSLPLAPGYSREQITYHITSELTKSSQQ